MKNGSKTKKILFVIGSLVALFAVLHIEENIRGFYAWNAYKQELEKQGFHFDMASITPPPL